MPRRSVRYDGGMSSDRVCVGRYPNGAMAGLAKGLLEEEGIDATLAELTSQAWLVWDVPMMGVRVEVPAEDADRARALLDEAEARTKARLDREARPATGELDAESAARPAPAAPPEPPGSLEQEPEAVPEGAPSIEQLQQDEVPDLPGDRAARRTYVCAVFGVVFSVFGLVALALLLDGVLRHGGLPDSPRGRRTWRWATFWTVVALTKSVVVRSYIMSLEYANWRGGYWLIWLLA